MNSRMGTFFLIGVVVSLGAAIDLIVTHLMLPPAMITPALSVAVYKILIIKWFLAGIAFGMVVMFLTVEAWVWKNWHSWNKFCCDHHERVYRSTMGISAGNMLRRK